MVYFSLSYFYYNIIRRPNFRCILQFEQYVQEIQLLLSKESLSKMTSISLKMLSLVIMPASRESKEGSKVTGKTENIQG